MASSAPQQPEAPGGFLQPSLPSPAPSSVLSASTVTPSSLPRQRVHPLRAGSPKEAALIGHIDNHILSINRRHAKKFSSALGEEGDEERGYENFKEVAKDVESIADVIWVSGTRMFFSSLVVDGQLSSLLLEWYDEYSDFLSSFSSNTLSRFFGCTCQHISSRLPRFTSSHVPSAQET
jgi:hypothetical protein